MIYVPYTMENENDLKDENSSSLCRACLSSESVKPLHNPNLCIIYEKLTGLKIVVESKISLNVCLKCSNKLDDISKFIETCILSNEYLTKIGDINTDDDEDNSFIETTEISPDLQEKITPVELFECKKCSEKFGQKDSLERHSCTRLDSEEILDIDDLKVEVKFEYEIQTKKESEQEQEQQGTDFNMKSHGMSKQEKAVGAELQEPQPCPQNDGESNSGVDTQFSIKKKRLELCLCNLCGKVFKRREYLRNHMATHMNVKPYTCNVCGSGFTQRQALSRHNLVHTKERPHKCTYCDKTFTRKEKLTDHIRCHEEGVDPHLCFHCGRRFKDREYLRKHLQYFLMGGKYRWRQNSKRCLCPDCGKEFHSEAYLKTHLKIHSGEKPFTCEICDKTFSVNSALQYHMKIHKGVKPFRCTQTQCNKTFRTNDALKVHERMHSGERPFRCTICDKGFVRSSHLKRHMKLHEDNIATSKAATKN